MSENIEREIKISLTKEQYNTAEKLFQWGKIIEQTNFYYIPQQDTGMTSIRVRQIGEKYFLQLKAPISENGALHVKKSMNNSLTACLKSSPHRSFHSLWGEISLPLTLQALCILSASSAPILTMLRYALTKANISA